MTAFQGNPVKDLVTHLENPAVTGCHIYIGNRASCKMSLMDQAFHRIRVSIFEEGKDYPVVVHIFYGKLIQEAYRYFQAHMRTDAFLKACVIDKKFGEMPCRSEQRTEHWNGRRWVDS